MANQNLTLALRIQTDLRRASAELDSFVTDLSQGATSSNAALTAAAGSLDKVDQGTARVAATSTQYAQAASRAASQSAAMSREIDQIGSSAVRADPSLTRMASSVKSVVASWIGFQAIMRAANMADSYREMAERVSDVTDSTAEFEQVQARLLETASNTYRPLAEAQELYIQTAKSLQDMGYQTSEALDITDSLSYAFVRNATDGMRANSAINAISGAMATGRLQADGWRSVLVAIPSIVQAIADVTGKSTEDVRRLGAEGKLSVEELSEALRRTVDENRAAAENMATTVTDAIARLTTNLSAYLGEANKSAGVTDLMASSIVLLAENLELAANVLGVVAAGAIARYITTVTLSTAATTMDTVAKLRAARQELVLAQAQAAQTAATLRQVSALQGLGTSHTQVAAATAAHEASLRRLAAAQGAVRGVGTLLGGPAGIAMMAASAAAAFWLFRDSAEAVESSLSNLTEPMDALLERFTRLTEVEQVNQLGLLTGEIRELRKESIETRKELETAMSSSLRALRNNGMAAEFDEIHKALGRVRAGLDVDWPKVIETLRASGVVPPEVLQQVMQLAAAQARVTREADAMAERHEVLSSALQKTRDSARNTGRTLSEESVKASEYLSRLKRQTEDLQDQTVVGRVTRDLRDEKDLQDATDDQRKAILEAAAAQDKLNAIRRQAQSDTGRYLAQLERQAALVSLTTDQEREWELSQKQLTVTQRERAEAALTTIRAQEELNKVTADSKTLVDVQSRLLEAQGRGAEAQALRVEKEYAELIKRLEERSDAAGLELVRGLINVEQAQARFDELQAQVERVLSEQQRREQTIQAQRQAGVISELNARRQLLELHTQTANAVDKLVPSMQELAQATGDPTALDRVSQLRQQMELLRLTTNEFATTLRDSFEEGLADGLEKLARGAEDLQEILDGVVQAIADAMLRLAAQNIAAMATESISNLFSSGADIAEDFAAATAMSTAISTAAASSAPVLAGGVSAGSATGAATLSAGITASGATAAATISTAMQAAGIIAGQTIAASMQAAAVMNAVGGGLPGFSGGGWTGPGQKYQVTGVVHAGEFVQPQRVMREPGAIEFMELFRREGMRALGRFQGYAEGGLVTPATISGVESPVISISGSASPTVLKQRLLPVLDPDLITDAMRGPMGEEIVELHITRNPGKFRSLLKL